MYRLSFREALSKGIRPDGRVQPNEQWLVDCKNLSCNRFGAQSMRSFIQPITDAALSGAGITKSYPFPQLFVGKSATILADATALYEVTRSSSGNWTVGAMPVYAWEDYLEDGSLTSGTIPTGKDWHFVDQWDTWMLFNGNCVVFAFSGVTFVQSTVTIQTGAMYNEGQLFLGGFDSTDLFDLADWPTYLADYRSTLPTELASPAAAFSDGMGPNWLWWSSVGAGDMWRFFSLPIMKYGYAGLTGGVGTAFSDSNPYWMQFASRGESAHAPMPWTGTVKRIMQCGQAMIAYGTNGVQTVLPEGAYGVWGLPGFGSGVGVMEGTTTRLAVGGNEQTQMFVDERRDLWVVENNGGVPRATNLGYRTIFTSATNVMIHHDPGENEFYFTGDSDFAYRLPMGGGMSRSPFIPTTVYFGRASGSSGPVGIRTLTSDNTTVLIQTNWFDSGGRAVVPNAVRIIVETGAEDASGIQAGLAWIRFPDDPDSNFTGYIDADNRGVVKIPPTSYYMAYILVQHADRTNISVTDIILEFDDGERRRVGSCLP